jgi:hypothetical protein
VVLTNHFAEPALTIAQLGGGEIISKSEWKQDSKSLIRFARA